MQLSTPTYWIALACTSLKLHIQFCNDRALPLQGMINDQLSLQPGLACHSHVYFMVSLTAV